MVICQLKYQTKEKNTIDKAIDNNKEIRGIAKFDDTNINIIYYINQILIDTDDKLPDDITFKKYYIIYMHYHR